MAAESDANLRHDLPFARDFEPPIGGGESGGESGRNLLNGNSPADVELGRQDLGQQRSVGGDFDRGRGEVVACGGENGG